MWDARVAAGAILTKRPALREKEKIILFNNKHGSPAKMVVKEGSMD